MRDEGLRQEHEVLPVIAPRQGVLQALLPLAEAPTTTRDVRIAWIVASVVLVAAACGGTIAAQPQDAGPVADAGTPLVDVTVPDIGVAEASPCPFGDGAACSVVLECIQGELRAHPKDPGGGGETFGGEGDGTDPWAPLLDYFREIAVQNGDCTTVLSCSYDPFVPAPADAAAAD
jgi:hypothetical protein